MRQEPQCGSIALSDRGGSTREAQPTTHRRPAGQAASAAAAIEGLSTRRVTPRRLGAENPSAGREGIKLPACIVLT